jgi:hypothetical protein
MRSAVLRGVALVAGLLALAAACSSSGHPASSATTTTTSPLDTPNSLPYAIQEKVAVGNGWLVDITNVHRHYVNPSLPSPKSGREYVAVDLWINNHSTSSPSPRLNAAKVFSIGDSHRGVDRVVPVLGKASGLDGVYAPQQSRTGQLVFDVPTKAALRMAMDGPLIGAQRSIFLVDPPSYAPGD